MPKVRPGGNRSSPSFTRNAQVAGVDLKVVNNANAWRINSVSDSASHGKGNERSEKEVK
jgi:hypothetical protein